MIISPTDILDERKHYAQTLVLFFRWFSDLEAGPGIFIMKSIPFILWLSFFGFEFFENTCESV